MTLTEAAKLLGMNREVLRRHCAAGRVPGAFRVTRNKRAFALNQLLAAQAHYSAARFRRGIDPCHVTNSSHPPDSFTKCLTRIHSMSIFTPSHMRCPRLGESGAKGQTMKIELRSIKHSALASEETHCYKAKLYVDGKHCADVSNDGHGGADYYHPVKDAPYSYADITYWIKNNVPPVEYDGVALEQNLEMVCGELVNEWLAARSLKRLLRDSVLTCDGKNIFQHSLKPKRRLETTHIDQIAARFPQRIVLNRLAFDEALELFRQHS